MCNNCNYGGNACWLILILLLFCGGGYGNYCGNLGCGCGCNCGNNGCNCGNSGNNGCGCGC